MKRASAGLLILMVLAVFAAALHAQGNFVYTNNNPFGQPNAVSAFQRDDSGFLTLLPGSPFLTGGLGSVSAPLFAANRITTVGNFLYAANDGSNNVTAFTIDPGTGALMPIAGSPFPTGAAAGSGISLAGTPDGQFLYASSAGSNNIRVFRILPGGALQPVGPLIPAGAGADGIKVSPNGRWLAVALVAVSPHGAVAMFSIDSITGALTPVPGSPFLVRGPGGPDGGAAGVDINCASDTVFVGEGNLTTTIVDVLSIDATSGALTPIPGSPFTPSGGVNSNVPLLCTTDNALWVSNQFSNTITSLTVAADGTLTPLAGSPFPEGGGADTPSGMATDQAGLFLYVANASNQVVVFNADSSGFLTLVPGSPFSTGALGRLQSIAAFPAKACPGPMVYKFQGTASGSLQATNFTNAPFTITATANPGEIFQFTQTCNVPEGTCTVFAVQATSATISVAGLTATITSPVGVFDNQTFQTLGFTRIPAGTVNSDLMDLQFSSPFGTYSLAGALGPLGPFFTTPTTLAQFNCSFGCVTTNMGILTINSVQNVAFTAFPRPGG